MLCFAVAARVQDVSPLVYIICEELGRGVGVVLCVPIQEGGVLSDILGLWLEL